MLGLSILSGAHMVILPELMQLLEQQGMGDVTVVVGGIIPEADRQLLLNMGISAVFGPGSSTGEIVEFIESSVGTRSDG